MATSVALEVRAPNHHGRRTPVLRVAAKAGLLCAKEKGSGCFLRQALACSWVSGPACPYIQHELVRQLSLLLPRSRNAGESRAEEWPS
ncbi:hypothetical protein NDU88_004295 [Pleurodeles waltl]|uniref:Uncharacterized protein n=1 Tax=Pleurodeles waltl TaxID=8319 RepID=A0AAV7RHS9_PLEWA|nr:hypothetical protein NDU88_004295 [Pleurodeles waltl]